MYLPPKDRERFSEYEASLRVELGAYLAEHVRREGYSVLARPRVTFETAEELASGTFGIATEREAPPEEAAAEPFEAPPRRVRAEPIPPAPPADLPQLPLDLPETPMFEPPPAEPIVSEPDPEPAADWPVEAPEPSVAVRAGSRAQVVLRGPPSSPWPPSPRRSPRPARRFPTSGSRRPCPRPRRSCPCRRLRCRRPPIPIPPIPADARGPTSAEPEPVGATQTVSAADAARAGLAQPPTRSSSTAVATR